MREQFEKLPEIAVHLNHGNVFFSEERQAYVSEFSSLHFVACFVNGAWYAYQEQQNKLNGALDLACKLQYSNGERIYNEIKELLK